MIHAVNLYFHTLIHLKPVQLWYQVIRRLQKNKLSKKLQSNNKGYTGYDEELSIGLHELDEDREYVGKFKPDAILNDCVNLLHEEHCIDWKKWNVDNAFHLWNFNLHYLEYLIALAVQYKETGDCQYLTKWNYIVDKWIRYGGNSSDAYDSYTISLRIPNLLICIELVGDALDEEKKETLYRSIYHQYSILKKNTEKSLLGNHYFENLKTIVICSLLFKEYGVYEKNLKKLLQQVNEQILSDGVHFELSWMYHKIILEDMLRVFRCLESCHKNEDAKKIAPTILQMTEAVYSFENGFGRTPLFNDAGDNVSKCSTDLRKAVENHLHMSIDDKRESFPAAGYYHVQNEGLSLLFDCGKLGPSYMPGHGHCDCLSFELAYCGKPIFVNSGTYQYQGERRAFFRSTKAHNTLTIDDREQSLLWKEHRAAQRIRKVNSERNGNKVKGSFVSYSGDCFSRTISLDQNTVLIKDIVLAKDKREHSARQYFHIAPDYTFRQEDIGMVILRSNEVVGCVSCAKNDMTKCHILNNESYYSKDFGLLEKSSVLEIITQFNSKIELSTSITIQETKERGK